MKSNALKVTEISATMTQFPASVWSVLGEEYTITCSVPINLTGTKLIDLRLLLEVYFKKTSIMRRKSLVAKVLN